VLATMLRSRLPDLIERNEEEWQRNHVCWRWTAANLSVGAAIKVALMQAKPLEELRCCDELSSLWSHRLTDFIEVTGDKTLLVGSYLFYCPIASRVIRSGKVFGASANFGTRHGAHQVGSRLETSESQASKFYMSFPSRRSSAVTAGVRKGYFEDLTLYVGSGFMKNDASLLVKDVADGGILHWSKEAMQVAAKVPRPSFTLEEKQLEMVAYFLEVVDDLMIEPRYNVSQSSSFEIFMRARRAGQE
jgi:hypothetical protein